MLDLAFKLSTPAVKCSGELQGLEIGGFYVKPETGSSMGEKEQVLGAGSGTRTTWKKQFLNVVSGVNIYSKLQPSLLVLSFCQVGMADSCINPKRGKYLKLAICKLIVYKSWKGKLILLSFWNLRSFLDALWNYKWLCRLGKKNQCLGCCLSYKLPLWMRQSWHFQWDAPDSFPEQCVNVCSHCVQWSPLLWEDALYIAEKVQSIPTESFDSDE